MKDKDTLVLVDEIGGDDIPGLCYINDCETVSQVVIGEGAELEYCPAHAADMALQLLNQPAVVDELAKRKLAVMVLDDSKQELRHLQNVAAEFRATNKAQYAWQLQLYTWIQQRLAAMYPAAS